MKTILEIRDIAKAVVAKLNHARFDLDTTDRLRAELKPLSGDAQTRPVLLDMSRVEFLPSATLGVLVEFANLCRTSGQPLALIRLQPKIHELLQICSLDQVFTICDGEEEALASR